jgi:membrane AbrB-like protein
VGRQRAAARSGALRGPVAAIGLNVGLRFERDTLPHLRGCSRRCFPPVVAVTVACAALAVPLVLALEIDPLSAYLAPTPGGISAVLVTSLDTGANSTVVFTSQLLRLLLVSAAAPTVLPAVAVSPRPGAGRPEARQ